MRIAYLTADFGIPVHGNKGASIHVREMSSALGDIGHDVRIFTPRKGGLAPAGFDVPVHEVKLSVPDKSVMEVLKNDPACDGPMAKEIRSMVYASTMRTAAQDLFNTWRPDAIYERYSLLASAGVDLARDYDVPLILEVNAPLSEEAANHRGLSFRRTVEEVERRVLSSATAVVAVSEEVKAWIVNCGVEESRVHVLPNGVNASRFEMVLERFEKPGELADRTIIGFVGTLKKWHGTEALLRAMSLIDLDADSGKPAHLLIVGDGPERPMLEHLAKELGVAHRVTFTGSVPHEDVPAWLSLMDIAVAPYDALTNFYFSPLKVYEYMAAGKAIIASDIGQINSIIRHGESGLLYEPGNLGALVTAINTLLTDWELSNSLGNAARAYVARNHSWRANAEAVAALINRNRGVQASSSLLMLEGNR